MSGDIENATLYDYSFYNYYNANLAEYTPTNNGNVREFRNVFIPIFYSSVFVLGFVGNALVLCVLIKHCRQVNMTDLCLLNLAVSDLLFVLCLPLYSHYAAVSRWMFGQFMCHFASGLHTLGFFSSIFFMVVMTLDRYVVILHAHTVARHRTLRVGVVLTAAVWMLSLLISLPSFAFTEVRDVSSVAVCDYAAESWRRYHLFTRNILGLAGPLLVMIVCYSRIIPTLVNMRSSKRLRAVRLIITIMVIFFLFWSPYNIVLFLDYLQEEGYLTDDLALKTRLHLSMIVTESFAYGHCCLNPIIYAFVGQKFMRRMTRLLKPCLPCKALCPRNRPESSNRNPSVTSRSSVTSTFVM